MTMDGGFLHARRPLAEQDIAALGAFPARIMGLEFQCGARLTEAGTRRLARLGGFSAQSWLGVNYRPEFRQRPLRALFAPSGPRDGIALRFMNLPAVTDAQLATLWSGIRPTSLLLDTCPGITSTGLSRLPPGRLRFLWVMNAPQFGDEAITLPPSFEIGREDD